MKVIMSFGICRFISTHNISHCEAVAKFCKDYKSHEVPARRDCIFIIALPWRCVRYQ